MATIIAKKAMSSVPPIKGIIPKASLKISLSIASALSITKALIGLQLRPNKKCNGLT